MENKLNQSLSDDSLPNKGNNQSEVPMNRPIIRARKLSGEWPDKARRCRDYPDKIIRVIDGRLLRGWGTGDNPDYIPDWVSIIALAETSRLYVRRTAATTHVVCLYTPQSGSDRKTSAYYSSSNVVGADRLAEAIAGLPLADGVVATDHCGLDHYPRHGFLCRRGHPLRAILAKEGCLPGHLFVL